MPAEEEHFTEGEDEVVEGEANKGEDQGQEHVERKNEDETPLPQVKRQRYS